MKRELQAQMCKGKVNKFLEVKAVKHLSRKRKAEGTFPKLKTSAKFVQTTAEVCRSMFVSTYLSY